MPCLPPVFLDINVAPVTDVATVTQTADAFSFGSLNSVAAGVQRRRTISSVRPSTARPSAVYRSPSCAHSG